MPSVPPAKRVTGDTTPTEVLIYAGGPGATSDIVNRKFDDDIPAIEDNLNRLGGELNQFNAAIPALARNPLETRRKQAELARKTTAGLKYKLRKFDGAQQTYKLSEKTRKFTPLPVKKSPTAIEYVIDEADYQEILRICTSMSLVMERSPSVFEKAEEEHIRIHYLVQLNGQYQGEATGETFNNKGKTDILIRHQDANIFVAECKFWGGRKALKETADQLLGYTTWRDTKTALIIFKSIS